MANTYALPAVVASAEDFLLPDLSGHTILTYTTTVEANYTVNIYFRVSTAPTVITITLSWTDEAGAQSMTIIGVSMAVGSYPVVKIPINAAAATAINVTAQAGTASQVNVSGSIVQETI